MIERWADLGEWLRPRLGATGKVEASGLGGPAAIGYSAETTVFRGLTARTLQRRLAMQGVVYRDLVQESRRRLALEYLQQGDTALTEIAFLLWYSERSAFTHAFQRWTGCSPGAHRRSGRARG